MTFGRRILRELPFALSVETLRSYGALMTGQVGRLVFSLGYFLLLANALSLGEFGLFATCSAIGVTLSRVAAFGFVSPVYRAACSRPLTLGSYLSGYAIALLLSLPLVALLAWAVHALVLAGTLAFATFALVLVAEILLWRTAEVLVIVSNGLNRFMRASAIVIATAALRAGAAGLLLLRPDADLALWALFYVAANGLALLLASAFLLPRLRPRWTPALWWGRRRDAAGVAGAEVLFYAQAELDKVLVLALGGPALAGIYAILLRLADLTAIPLRAMNTLLLQAIMRSRGAARPWPVWVGIEAAVFAVSVAGLGTLALLLNVRPDALGENVALAAGFVALILFLPGFRNLVELHTELLWGFERPLERLAQLLAVGIGKAALLATLLAATSDLHAFAWWLNGVFAALYLVSAAWTYAVIQTRPAGTGPAAARAKA